jgi:hypothetical protein
MLGIANEDQDGKEVRIERRGKHMRASRTGGIAVRAQKKHGPVTLTANSSRGVRASARIANGVRVALQNSRFQLIGLWRAGPFGLNLSKTGASGSIKNRAGSFNLLKPQYSSSKIAGVQVRGKKAAHLHLGYMLVTGLVFLSMLAVQTAVSVMWLFILVILYVWDWISGFVRGVRCV